MSVGHALPPSMDIHTQAAPSCTRASPTVGFVLHVMQVAGAEVLVAETIRRLGSRIRPFVYCLDGIGQLGEQMQRDGVEVVSFDRRPGIDLRLITRFAARLRTDRVDILHAHQYTPYFYGALANLRAGWPARVILTEHGRAYPDIVGSRRRFLNRWFLQHLASDVNAVARFSAEAVQQNDGFTKWPISIIPNGIETSRYGDGAGDVVAARQALGLPVDHRYVTCVARFHPVKDHRGLITAFAQLASSHPDVDLVLAGDGQLRGELEQQVRDLGLAERVRFLGVRRDVPVVLRASDVFVLGSESEGASITVLEAMASGLPIVTTNVGGNPELVRHEQEGLLVPRSDPAAFAAAMSRVLDDPALARRLGAAGRARARAEFDIDVTIAAYGRLYGVR